MNNSNCSHPGNRTRASWVKASGPRVAMAEVAASSRNASRVRLHGTIIKISVPLPNILKCGEKSCEGGRGSGPWSGDRKRQLTETHIKERHFRRSVQYTTQHAIPCTESLSPSILRQSLELTIASAIDGSQGFS
ncbi:hypothetical protein OUZ56_025945 [Daphnia magna]|uniref:Uncharacterized protein n=1 Tax=Daphnia magna TaxID=35525 RepID=A0ABQ9ZKX1_9CRUS|nr:hypothetical protein OUZ56_025945 [Daphnia magna]